MGFKKKKKSKSTFYTIKWSIKLKIWTKKEILEHSILLLRAILNLFRRRWSTCLKYSTNFAIWFLFAFVILEKKFYWSFCTDWGLSDAGWDNVGFFRFWILLLDKKVSFAHVSLIVFFFFSNFNLITLYIIFDASHY